MRYFNDFDMLLCLNVCKQLYYNVYARIFRYFNRRLRKAGNATRVIFKYTQHYVRVCSSEHDGRVASSLYRERLTRKPRKRQDLSVSVCLTGGFEI